MSAGTERKRIRCRSCGRHLSAVLHTVLLDDSATNQQDQEPFLPPGHVYRSDGDFFTGSGGRYIINLSDRLHLHDHSEPRRLSGCCGRAGTDGPNQICACGAEVATEKSDCWMPHALIFERDAVDLVDEES